MNPLKRGFLEAVKGAKEKKGLFLVLVLIQILFLASVSFIGVGYQIKIYEKARGIIEPLESINYEEMEKVTSGEDPQVKELMKKMVLVTKSYKEMVKSILEMILLMGGSFLVFNGLGWSLANYIIKKGNIWKYWGKFVLVSLVFLVPIGAGSYFGLKALIGAEGNLLAGEVGEGIELVKGGMKVAGGIFLVMGYFMVVGFCLLEEKVGSLFKKIFLVGVKKGHWMVLSLFLVLAAIGLSLGLVYFSLNNLLLTVLGSLVLIIVLAGGKVFLVGVWKELNKIKEK